MNQSTERAPRTQKAKVFGTFLVDDEGSEKLIAYTEHFSSTQAQSKALGDRIVTRLADHNDLIRIGRENIEVDYLEKQDDGPQNRLDIDPPTNE